jgi:hypothetical protein
VPEEKAAAIATALHVRISQFSEDEVLRNLDYKQSMRRMIFFCFEKITFNAYVSLVSPVSVG